MLFAFKFKPTHFRKKKMKNLFLIALFSSFAFTSGTVSASVIYNLTGSNNSIPFLTQSNYEQVYSSSQFTTGLVNITGINFKVAQDLSGYSFGPTPVTLDIDLSTTAITPSTISSNFSTNQGTGNVNVFSGTTIISSNGGNVFDIMFPFTTFFSFDPSAGNLLVHLNVSSSQSAFGAFDFGSPTPLAGRAVSNVFSGPNSGLATEFVTAPATPSNVPEPASVALIGLGLLGLAALRRKSAK